MSEYRRIPTSPEVWAVIRARHTDLIVFGSYSAPDGDYFSGNTDLGVMETTYGFADSDMPILEARTTWDINRERSHVRNNERHEYWLCVPKQEAQ